jgi:hypothetical protein
MIRLSQTLNAWNTPMFRETFKHEIESLDPGLLPLQEGLSRSSHVTATPFRAVPLAADREDGQLRIKTGIFYTGIIAGCSCADDPTPIDEQTEYCVLEFAVDTATGVASVQLTEE